MEEVRVYAHTVAQPQISLLKQLPAKMKPFGDFITFCSWLDQKNIWFMTDVVPGSRLLLRVQVIDCFLSDAQL